MSRFISMKIKTVKSAAAKPTGKSLSGYKSIGIELAIHFYEIEDGDKTE